MPTSVPDKILKVAARLFAESGFEGTVMQDIAKRANVALPTIYHHFGNKRNLYNSACTSVFSAKARLHWAILTGSPELSDHERLYQYLLSLAKDFMSDPVYSNLLHRELTDRNHIGLKELSQQSFAYTYTELYNLCGRLFPHRDKYILALSLHSLIFGIVNFLRFGVHIEPKLKENQTPAGVAKLAVMELLPEVDWSRVLPR